MRAVASMLSVCDRNPFAGASHGELSVTEISWRELRENLADVINRVRFQNERIAITRHGKVVAELAPASIGKVESASGSHQESAQAVHA